MKITPKNSKREKQGWQGFLIESKHYMNYPKCGAIKFWKQFPKAFVRFYWFTFNDWLNLKFNKIKRGN